MTELETTEVAEDAGQDAALLSVPVLRPHAVRAALVLVVGALGGLVMGAVAEWITGWPVARGIALMGLWWAGMVFLLGVVETWAARKAGDSPGRRLAWALGVGLVGGGALLVLGGLQYQYGVGVIRGGSLEAGYGRVVRVLRQAKLADGLIAFAFLVPFVADVVGRTLSWRLVFRITLCVVSVGAVSVPLIQGEAPRTGPLDQWLILQAVVLIAFLLPLSHWLAQRIVRRRWPDEGAAAASAPSSTSPAQDSIETGSPAG